MPDRLRPADDLVRGGAGTGQPAAPHLRPGREWPPPGLRGAEKFQTDPHWKDYILFYEYFHGDNGAGIGASHQTGWTGCIARIIQLMGDLSREFLMSPEVALAGVRKTAGK